jgi:hypothetical protein
MAYDWAQVETTLCDWVASQLPAGAPCILANQNAPQPQKPYATILITPTTDPTSAQGAGMDERRLSAVAPGVVRYQKFRQFGVSLNVYSNVMTGNTKATALLEQVVESLALQSVCNTFRANARITCLPVNAAINDVSALLETRGESRAQIDLSFNYVSSLSEDLGYFTKINTDGIAVHFPGGI